jgi:hypothetical protein
MLICYFKYLEVLSAVTVLAKEENINLAVSKLL